MIKKLMAIVLILVFAGAGVAAGLMFKPEAEVKFAEMGPCGDDPNAHASEKTQSMSAEITPVKDENISFDYVKLHNQFIIERR